MTMLRALRPNLDLASLSVVSAACGIVALTVPLVWLRLVCAIPLAILTPGYAVRCAVFARSPLEVHGRVMLIPALSLMNLVIGALVLNEMPGGIRPLSWVIWLLVVTVGGSAVAGYRRATPFMRPSHRPRRERPPLGDILLYVLAALLAVGALAASRLPLSAKNVIGYARLSVTPTQNDRAVDISVLNGFEHPRRFDLNLTVNFSEALSRTISLAPGRSQTFVFALSPSKVGLQVSATLAPAGGVQPLATTSLSVPAFGR